MKIVTNVMFQILDGRQVVEIRTGYQKYLITWPKGADVRVEKTSNVTKIGERPVLAEDENCNPFDWDYPIPHRLLDPDGEWNWLVRDNPDEESANG